MHHGMRETRYLGSGGLPTILRLGGYRFFFYSNEGSEPPHIHVVHGEAVAKYWLEPVELAVSRRFRAHELSAMRDLVFENRQMLLEAWHDHFGTGR